MSPKKVAIGEFYVNDKKGIVRKVTEVTDDNYIKYDEYFLLNGMPIAEGSCRPQTLKYWTN